MIAPVLILLLAAEPIVSEDPPPAERRFSVYREVVLLSGAGLSAAGTATLIYGGVKDVEPALILGAALVAAGSVFSLGTAFGSHRWQEPPHWVFVVGPILGLLTGVVGLVATAR